VKCYIFSSATIKSYSWLRNIDFSDSFIICADGGIKHTKQLGIVPDVWLGDGDSLTVDEIIAKKIIRYPVKKDNTDTDLAVMYALDNGYTDITIIGGLGGRVDHEFSHFCLLKKMLDCGTNGRLIDEKNTIAMANKSFKLENDGRKYVSFFPFGGDVKNFSVKGLLYEAEGILLDSSKVQASSNSFVDGVNASISFDSGYVLIITSDD
jgi:thiamine pyrophosphokinase